MQHKIAQKQGLPAAEPAMRLLSLYDSRVL